MPKSGLMNKRASDPGKTLQLCWDAVLSNPFEGLIKTEGVHKQAHS